MWCLETGSAAELLRAAEIGASVGRGAHRSVDNVVTVEEILAAQHATGLHEEAETLGRQIQAARQVQVLESAQVVLGRNIATFCCCTQLHLENSTNHS